MRARTVAAAVAALAGARAAATEYGNTPFALRLDGTTALHRFDGHGALSAGASSRLLLDYPEPQRSQILDYLFKPNFGAAMHILKVEIGGDAASTDGTEPSWAHVRSELGGDHCSRGYEAWLISEAKARNPNIITYGLSWGTPLWVGNGSAYYSPEGLAYHVGWAECIRRVTGVAVDYLGLHNEASQPTGADYVTQLRSALDTAGLSNTQIIVQDGQWDEEQFTTAQANASFAKAVYAAGEHYPCNRPHPELASIGWAYWASEDYSRDPAWDNGGTYWGSILNTNYVVNNMTATISWSLIWSAYTNLVCNGAGFMRAHEPWSGNYEVSAPIWMTAHWGQFVQPGWRFLHVPGGGSGFLTYTDPRSGQSLLAGSYVSLVPPVGSPPGLTLIIETLNNNACTHRNLTNVDVTVTLAAGTGLPPPGTALQVWSTTSEAYFVQLADATVGSDGSFTLHVPADAIITVSTTPGAAHGSFPTSPIPAAAPFPIPYTDGFNDYADDALAHYFSDQGGSWAVRNGSLVQVAGGDPGPNAWAPNPQPLTQIGGETWEDYAIAATAVFSPEPVTGGLPAVEAARAALLRADGSAAVPAATRNQRERQWRAGKGLSPVDGAKKRATAARGARRSSGLAQWLLRDAPVGVAPCDATDAAQVWAWNISSPFYLSAGSSFGHSCLNVGGCDPTSIIMWACLTDGSGSSCGAPNGDYPNLQWSWNPSTGALTTHMSDGWALTLNTANGSLSVAPFTGAPGQVWSYNATSGQVSLPALGRCLSLPPQRSYVRVCGRIGYFNGFDATTPMEGYCMVVDAHGGWALTVADTPVANGTLAAPFSPSTPHRLAISMAGPVITGFVDGVALAQTTDTQFTSGNAMLGSGWHQAAFDDFAATAPL